MPDTLAANRFAQGLSKKGSQTVEIAPTPSEPVRASEEAVGEERPKQAQKPSRASTKHVGGYFVPEVSKQLRAIAVQEDTTLQDLLGEAIDMLFQSRQMPTIARKPVGE